jgi:uncharacterized protein YjbI with pentapeptide repeats
LHLTDLREAKLIHANLQGASLQDTSLTGTNLQEANLLGVTNVSIDLLAKAKTLYLAQLDQELKDQLIKDHPHLFEEPSF